MRLTILKNMHTTTHPLKLKAHSLTLALFAWFLCTRRSLKRTKNMATVIDVSSNLGVYMLKGWVRLNMAASDDH